jgi:sugar/nucleoside kinase (ribokinase family)
MNKPRGKRGLFVGMVALDIIYLVENLPDRNQKIVAIDSTISAGGPATNAAVTFSYLGNSATLLGVVGRHPLSQIIYTELQEQHVKICDLDPNRLEPIPTASILVTQATGDRAVISLSAPRSPSSAHLFDTNLSSAHSPSAELFNYLNDTEIVLIDGHQMATGEAIAQQAKASGIPVVADCGSWKAGFEKILSYVDYAICSGNFYPPHCQSWAYQTTAEVLTYLETYNIPHIAITGGERPIQFRSLGQSGEITSGEIAVPAIAAVDTLGAGDIFHGAFCHYILQGSLLENSSENSFEAALTQAAQVASYSCQFFGTRHWMETGEKFL